jgi:RHH-type rel operon transcriptional repressor/antitoxin RelB
MLSVRLNKNTEERLKNLSTLTHRSKSFYVQEAIKKYLDDLEDIYIALERITTIDRKLYTSQEVLDKLDHDV